MSERTPSAAAGGWGWGAALKLTDRQGKVEEEQNREPEGQRGGDMFVCQTGRFSRYISAFPLEIDIHASRSVIFLPLTVTDIGRFR